jgi:hypothetical protein
MAESIFETLLIVVKCSLILTFLYMGLNAHLSLQSDARVLNMFIYYMILLSIFLVYEFCWPHMGLQFYVLLGSQIGQVYQLRMMRLQVKEYIPASTNAIIQHVFNIFYVYYAVLFVVGAPFFHHNVCLDERLYPLTFQCIVASHIPLFAVAMTLHVKGYFAEHAKQVYEKEYLVEQETRRSTVLSDSQYPIHALLKAQSKKWCTVEGGNVLGAIFILIGVHGFDSHNKYMTCESETEWKLESTPASLFMMAHIIMVVSGCVQMSYVFYKIPLHMGYFDVKNHENGIIELG